jgi:hypothetical protein
MTAIEKRVHELTGQGFLLLGDLNEARKEYHAAGEPLTKDQLIACGMKCLEKGWLGRAREAFEAAGEPLPKDQFIAYGMKCLEEGMLGHAREAFEVVARLEMQSVQS